PRDPGPDDEPCDEGLVAAIENALDDAGIGPGDIDLIVPLALGVPDLDARELGAIQRVFTNHLDRIPLLTLANRTGNTMAGHGGLMTAAAAMCLHTQTLPAGMMRADGGDIINSENSSSLNRALVCTGSLGGQTGALVLGR
ncbi:MAG: hypothetical protein WD114_00035, partial [Phycisphaerales bacterium]